MSLIADALRKAGSPSPAPTPPPSGRWVYTLFLIGCGGLALVFLPHHLPVKPSTPTSLPQKIQKPSAPAAVPQRTGLNLLRVAESQWRLTGIVQGGDGKPIALVNNRVVEAGDSLGDAHVVRVTENQVEIETEGRIKTLKLR